MASDLRFGTARSKVAFLFVRVGLAGADMGACNMLPRIIGAGRAAELLYTGRAIDGNEAVQWGFYNKLCEPEAVLTDAQALARSLADGPTFAHAMTKKCIHQEWNMGIDEATQTPYLVMEYLEGQPLDRMLEKGSIPFPRACAWAAEVATALGAAHRKGVIHGDVKPANILITDENRVKLTDFGMARLASHATKDTPLLGTPAYWCPEQILGKPQDARSDIFSLGGVLYEMATGQRPFDSNSLQGICGKVLSSAPLLPSHANPSLPVAFDEVIARCMIVEYTG